MQFRKVKIFFKIYIKWDIGQQQQAKRTLKNFTRTIGSWTVVSFVVVDYSDFRISDTSVDLDSVIHHLTLLVID